MENYDYGQSMAHASTVFLYACYVGDYNTVDRIIKANFIKNLSAVSYHGYPPMVIATCFNRVDVIKCLIARDFATNVRCVDWVTPLHYAMLLPDTVVSEIFIRAGASYSARDKLWRSPIIYASCNSSPDLLYLLSQKLPISSETDRTCMTVLHYAAIHGSIQNVRFLMENYPELAVRQDRQGRTPLHYAVYSGYKGIIKCLLKVKRQNNLANMPDNLGFTPLHIAAIFNNISIVKKLIHKGAKIEAASSTGVNVVHLSCKYGTREVLELYIASAQEIAPFTLADCNRLKPIHYCIMNACNAEIILDYFLQFYKSHNVVLDESDTRLAIDLVLLHNQFNCLYLLVSYNFISFSPSKNLVSETCMNASALNVNGETVLTEMLIMDRFNKKLNSRFFEMIENVDDYNKTNSNDESPLHIMTFDLFNFNNLIKEKKFAECDLFFLDKIICNVDISVHVYDKHNHSPLMNYLLTFGNNFVLNAKNFEYIKKLCRDDLSVMFAVSSFFHCTPWYVAVKLACVSSNAVFFGNLLNFISNKCEGNVDQINDIDLHNKRNLLHVVFKYAKNEEFLIDAIKIIKEYNLFNNPHALDKFNLTPAHYYLFNCCSRNSLPHTYIIKCFDLDKQTTKNSIPLLMFFLHFSKINISTDVCSLLSSENDFTFADQYKNTIFHTLAKNKNSSTTEKILYFLGSNFTPDKYDYTPIIDCFNHNHWTPFHIAAYLGNLTFFSLAIKFLREKINDTKKIHAIINRVCTDLTNNKQTVLHLAANCSNTKLISYILELFEESSSSSSSTSTEIIDYINCKDANNNTSLHYSVNNENNLILLFEKVKTHTFFNKQQNVIAKRISKVNLELNVNLFNQTPLHLLCLFYNVPLNLFELIFKYSNVNGLSSFFRSPNQIELTPMHCLIMGCQLGALFSLTELDRKTEGIKKIMNDIEQICVDEQKFSLLHSAVLSANLLVIKFVLSYIDYSQLKNKNNNGLPKSSKYFDRTPLHLACKLFGQEAQKKTKATMKDMISVLLILCIHGKIDVNSKDKFGETAAMYAIDNDCFRSNEDFINLVNFDVKNDNNETLLHRAIRNNDEKLASQLLVRMNKDQINTQLNDSGKTVLHLAVEYDMGDLIETLISYGADRTILDSDGNLPFEPEQNSGGEEIDEETEETEETSE